MIQLEINLEIQEQELTVKLCTLTAENEKQINPEVWYTPESVGRLNIPPFGVEIRDPDIPIRVKQYPVSQEGKERLQPVIKHLLH